MSVDLKSAQRPSKERGAEMPPSEIADFFSGEVSTAPLLHVSHCRWDRAGSLSGSWLAISSKEVVIFETSLLGLAPVLQVPLASISSVKCSPISGGAVMVAVSDGKKMELLRCDAGQAPLFSGLCHLLARQCGCGESANPPIANWQDAYRQEVTKYQKRFCPSCTKPLPRNSKVCPFCLNKGSTLLRILGFSRPYHKALALMAVLMVAGTAASLLPPQIVRILIDDVLLTPEKASLLPWLVGAMAVVMIATHLLTIWRSRIGVRVGCTVTNDIQSAAFHHLQKLSLGYFNKQQTGALMSRINNDARQMQGFLVEGIQYTVVNLLTLVGIASVLVWMNPFLGFLVLLPIPFVVLFSAGIWRRVRRRFRNLWAATSSVTSYLNDALSGIRVIKSFGKEETECLVFDKKLSQARSKTIDAEQSWQTWIPLMHLIIQSSLLLVWYFGSFEVYEKKLSIGELVAYVSYLGMIYGPLQLLTRINDWLTRSLTAAARVFEILDTEDHVPAPAHGTSLGTMRGEIELRDVVFGYERHQPVIKGISLRIPEGEMVGFVGKSGAGKSTLINLIGRLYDPDEGQIYLDGVDLRDIPPRELRQDIGYVLQENFLFSASIAKNIAYARPEASREEIIASAHSANAHEFIMKLPDGYDTYVGERGARLSGGERQRIAIARALLQNPKILILDEATSSVDTETESKIQEALSRLIQGRTTIAIAHRLSTLRHATKLVVLHEGKVVEEGPHAELMAKPDGVYRRLVEVQTEWNRMIGVGG